MYSIAAGIGIVFSIVYLKRHEKCESCSEADAELAYIYALVGAFCGAKLLWLLINLDMFVSELPYILTATEAFLLKYVYSGFVFYGGLAGCITAVFLYARCNHIRSSEMLRILVPMIPLVHAFGRIGCFCMGCCYGIELHNSPTGVIYHASEIAPNGVSLVPVQLYEAVVEFAIFIHLRNTAKRSIAGIRLLGRYLVAYPIVRFVLEFLRGDTMRGFIGVLSISQVISILFLVAGIILVYGKNSKTAQTVHNYPAR